MAAVLGWRSALDERERAQRRIHDLLLIRLRDTSRLLDGWLERLERQIQAVLKSVTDDEDAIRRLVRQSPQIDHVFVLNADGALHYPNPKNSLNASERQFLDDYGSALLKSDLLPSTKEGDRAPEGGWLVRFQGPGLQLLYCRHMPSGKWVGVHLTRARWLADLIAELPETIAQDEIRNIMQTRIRLVDSDGLPVYQWGAFEPDPEARPFQELAPTFPLSSWRLQHFADQGALAAFGQSSVLGRVWMFAAAMLLLAVGGVWAFREYDRNYRESMQRVSFVNQVSHELKTPLTNIRMYSELMEMDLQEAADDASPALRGNLKVIVEESQRLSRLIGNVLAFAKGQRSGLTLRPRPAVVDEVVTSVLQRFEPSLRRRGIEAVFRPSGGRCVRVDVDALEQILENLLSNVEKYAADGKWVEIVASTTRDETIISVSDKGRGIPHRQRDRIFQPFFRGSNQISDSPGTGIGLTISRQLARIHGGDLMVMSSDAGARFDLRLHTPSCDKEASA